MNRKSDRRTDITKRIFHETLIELLQTSHISELSVKKLCEAADLNRSTFYAYYQNPMELLQEIENETYEQLESYIAEKKHGNNEATHRTTMIDTLEFVKNNPSLFKVLLGKNGNSNFLKNSLLLTEDFYKNQDSETKNKKYYIQLFYVAGLVAVMEAWLDNGCVESTSEISSLVAKLINNSTFH